MPLTDNPNDYRLTYGADDTPIEQSEVYLVLPEAERAKGFVRPVQRTYVHKNCGGVTTMGQALAETYARQPNFYSSTYCVKCQKHRPVSEFRWFDDEHGYGSEVGQ